MTSKNPQLQVPDVMLRELSYELPAERIALHPLASREQSRCLVASRNRLSKGSFLIEDHHFGDLPELLPKGAFLVINDSKVLPARIPCAKSTGGAAEVLLLEPIRPTPNPALALQSGSPGVWKAMVGGKKIRPGDCLGAGDLKIVVLEKSGADATVELAWEPGEQSLAERLEQVGRLPLPPYLKRELTLEDSSRYQTTYARLAGSVAAPTAGLHLTDSIRQQLKIKGVLEGRVTLHVGAGTFRPVDAEKVSGHTMHAERFEVSLEFLEGLADSLSPRPHRPPVVAVGTTSLRVLETLYWLGRRILRDPRAETDELSQWECYAPDEGQEVFADAAVRALIDRLSSRGLEKLVARTQIMVVPGYRFRTADWLITNFHQPGSSLILLVAAWMGEHWKEIYEHALKNDYRFLSYGDGSLLKRSRE